MPWFPDFVSAVELVRGQTRAAGLADPVGQYFTALNEGDTHALETVWPGEVVVYDPRAGEIRGHRQLRRFVSQNQSWLAERHARIETVASTILGGRAVVELLAHLAGTSGNWRGRWRSSPNRRTNCRWCSAPIAANGQSTGGATSGLPSSRPGTSTPVMSSAATRPHWRRATPKRQSSTFAAGRVLPRAHRPAPHPPRRCRASLVLHQALQRRRWHRPAALRGDRRRRALRAGIQRASAGAATTCRPRRDSASTNAARTGCWRRPASTTTSNHPSAPDRCSAALARRHRRRPPSMRLSADLRILCGFWRSVGEDGCQGPASWHRNRRR